ncbi:MAG TPA: diacylglycerol kinase family protein [Kofleriaceae bacterium]|nr:diacylglycerol kinase family protein [Kofleriaceae bacterium]
MSQTEESRRGRKRPSRRKPEAEIILLCNPRAGGRWKELARILDSEEARHVRRIVTDSVEDIAPALGNIGREAKLICVYGGDGTIQRVLDRLDPGTEDVALALLGGGTMNVTSRWCGFARSPAQNFRAVVRAYVSHNLLLKEVPLLEAERGGRRFRGFTFGMGPIVRVLAAYENGKKGKGAAVVMGAPTAIAAIVGRPSRYAELLHPMEADVSLDGEPIPYRDLTAVFANVTGQINPGVVPFVEARTRDSFHCAAYAVTPRELAFALPMLVRGWLPMDARALTRPGRLLRRDGHSNGSRPLPWPTDPRYINKTASTLEIKTAEPLYTIDGEVIASEHPHIRVTLGPTIKLAVSPAAAVRAGLRAAAAPLNRGGC